MAGIRFLLGALCVAGTLASTQAQGTLTTSELRKQQRSIARLGVQPGVDADRALLALLDRQRSGDLPPALWLDLFEAAAKRDDEAVRARVAQREQELARSRDPLSRYRECLEGGSATEGREIFTTKAEAGCIRCHRIRGAGGEIGPDLTILSQATDRIFILESIVEPSAVITNGFPHILLTLKNRESLAGILSNESTEELTITSITDGRKRIVKTADIAGRTPLPSAMPPGFATLLGKRAIRDLVEFLAAEK